MAAYYEDHQGQIYADMAHRLGVIVKQYDYYIDEDDDMNFDSTMCVTFLQNLLTIYCEYWKNEKFGLPALWKEALYNKDTLVSSANYFGIEPAMVVENNIVKEGFTTYWFLTHLRNALSHPTAINADSETQSTGYYSIANCFGRISEYVFIDSQDVTVDKYGRNCPKRWDTQEQVNTFLRNNGKKHEFNIQEVSGKFEITNPRVYKICLTSRQLKNLVVKLSSLLAQPVQKNWNGKELNPKILEYAA